MHIFIKLLDGKTKSIFLNISDTVRKIKEIIFQDGGPHPDE